MASTVRAARTALLDIIRARQEIIDSQTPVLRHEPLNEADWQDGFEVIYLGGRADDPDVTQTEDWKQVGGGGSRDESYDLIVTVRVHTFSDSPEDVEDRAWLLRDEISEAIKADKTLAGTLDKWAAVDRTEQRRTPFKDGWGVDLTLTINCKAQRV